MPKDRTAGRPGPQNGRPAPPPGPAAGRAPDRPDECKVTMWLPDELARKLRAVAAYRGEELGQVAAPGIERELADWRCYPTGSARPARPAAGRPDGPIGVVAGPEPADGPGPADEAAA